VSKGGRHRARRERFLREQRLATSSSSQPSSMAVSAVSGGQSAAVNADAVDEKKKEIVFNFFPYTLVRREGGAIGLVGMILFK
jgi:hypothetical protein